MKLTTCAYSDIGLSRNRNEDSFLNDKAARLFVVADGMGGHAAGEVASRIAIESVVESFSLTRSSAPHDRLSCAIEQANTSVAQQAQSNKDWSGMGTTLTILLIEQNQGFLGHVGDSRLYLSRLNDFKQLSDDHTPNGAQIRLGTRTREHKSSSDLSHMLLQAVGITPKLDICFKQFPLATGDRLLLCSDGLTNMITDKKIKAIVQKPDNIDNLGSALIDQALSAGGNDNITVVLIQINELD